MLAAHPSINGHGSRLSSSRLVLTHTALSSPASLRASPLPSTVREDLPQLLEALTAEENAPYFKPLK